MKRRYASLDGMRGVAAVLVVLLHVDWSNHLTDNNLVKNGYLAVDLFFIISGFVIAANYSTRINSLGDMGRFLVVRIFRLYPLHFAILSVFVAIEFAKLIAINSLGVPVGRQAPFSDHTSLPALVANLFLVQGLPIIGRETWNGPSWSISCEFVAYFVFGFAFFHRLILRTGYVVVGLMAACTGYLVIALQWNTLNVIADWGIIRCFAGFFLGTLAFDLSGKHVPVLKTIAPMQIAIALGALAVMAFARGSLVLLAIPLFVLLILATQSDKGPVARALISWPTQFLGRVSYSVYMVHHLFVVLVLIVLKRSAAGPLIVDSEGRTIVAISPWLGDGLVALLVMSTIAAAAFAYTYIEEPGRVFGRRLARFGTLAPS